MCFVLRFFLPHSSFFGSRLALTSGMRSPNSVNPYMLPEKFSRVFLEPWLPAVANK